MNFLRSKATPGILATIITVLLLLSGWFSQTGAFAQEGDPPPSKGEDVATEAMEAFLADRQPAASLSPLAAVPCVGGMAGIYPCANVDLLAFMPLADIGGGAGNDIWGWTDPLDNAEYAIMGRSSGTAFVDISDPENPVYLGNLPTHTTNSSWRDIKVYANYAFIVSEAGGHGMQVFDLTELRSVITPPETFAETAHYSVFGSAHNIVINEDSGFAYGVGTNTCSGGLHMVNIQNPLLPTNAGCFSSDGYTHDAQCVNYVGPDPDHQGAEVCFNANEDTLTIVDVTNKTAPAQLSRTGYSGSGYTHQGWVTPDHAYFLLDDELDESSFGHNTRTRVWDITDLDAPVLIGFDVGTTPAIDHNQYVHQGYTYQANYRSGLRILDLTGIATASLTEAAFFDIYPSSDSPSFNGAWSVYPYFDSGVAVVSGIEQGLFILQPDLQNNSPAINLAKTVGTDPGICAATNSIAVTAGTDVYYCYEVTNTGTLTLGLHTLIDDQLGPIFTAFSYDLAPGASIDTFAAGLTISTTITNTTVNSAVWTAYNPGPADVVSATASATVDLFANLQVAHLAPFAMDPGTAVTITLDGAPVLTNFAFADSTGYLPVAPGSYLVEITPAGSPTPAISGTVVLAPNQDYTALAVGDGTNQPLGLLALLDDNTAPAPGNFKLRLGHLAPFAPGLATADIRLQDGTPVLTGVSYADIYSGYLELPAGTYDLKITTPGGASTLIDPLPVYFGAGDIFSAFAVGDGTNQPLGVFALPAGSPGFLLPTGRFAYLPLVPKLAP